LPLLSLAYISIAMAVCFRLFLHPASLALSLAPVILGMIMEAKTAIMATTMVNSTMVKPRFARDKIFG